MPSELPERLIAERNANGPDWPCWITDEQGRGLAQVGFHPDRCPEPARLAAEIARRWNLFDELRATVALAAGWMNTPDDERTPETACRIYEILLDAIAKADRHNEEAGHAK